MQIVAASKRGGVTSSIPIRRGLAWALATAAFPEGPPYLSAPSGTIGGDVGNVLRKGRLFFWISYTPDHHPFGAIFPDKPNRWINFGVALR